MIPFTNSSSHVTSYVVMLGMGRNLDMLDEVLHYPVLAK